ncbi:MAG: polysaccharide biosynthesis tyrosine autokinase [Gemmatimonadota bacterium]|nr:polysaccharide biosynthesis tyrosine autokinase [Gemmatimonadota bacterium]
MTNDDGHRGGVPVPFPQGGQAAPAHTYYYPDYTIEGGGGDTRELARLGQLLWRKKFWILGCALIGLGAGWGASRLIAPEYQSTTTLAINDRGTGRQGPITTGQLLAVDGWTDVFQSRRVVSDVVLDQGLLLRRLDETDPSLFTSFRVDENSTPGEYVLGVGAGGAWTLMRSDSPDPIERGREGDEVGSTAGFSWFPAVSRLEPGSEVRFRVLSLQAAVTSITNNLVVGPRARGSDILAATLTWHDPHEAADILNALAVEFIELADLLKTNKIREEVRLLKEQADLTGSLLETAEFDLQAFRVSAITEPTEPVAIPAAPGATAGSVAGASDPMFATFQGNKLRVDALLFESEQIDNILADVDAGGEVNLLAVRLLPSANQFPELQTATQDLQTARVNRRTLLQTYTDQAPEVVAVTQQIVELERIVIPDALRRLNAELRDQADLLNRQIASQGEQLREIPQRTIQTARLTREMNHAAALHQTLLARLKEAELAEATMGPGITILNPAWPNMAPRGEKPGGVMTLFALLGLGIGVAGVLVFDHFDRRIHSPDQVTGALGLPLLAVVPRLQAAPDPASPAAAIAVESFRGLRTQIAHVDGRAEGILLITSPAPREGKSMVSANLAISHATAGYRTVLLDGDTRRGRAHEMFNLQRSPGLTDYLMDRAGAEEILEDSGIKNLTLIPRGAPGGFNADLLEGPRMVELMEKLRDEYDVVVVDGPPLAAGADALFLGGLVDKVVLVVRAGTTTEDLAKAKLEAVGNVDLPIVGAVLNALSRSAPDYEYYVHYYYADAEAV